MSNILEIYYEYLPNFLQNVFVSAYNIVNYKRRYGAQYKAFSKIYNDNNNLDRKELEKIQSNKLKDLLEYTLKHSEYYRELYKDIDIKEYNGPEFLKRLPIVNKEDIRKNVEKVRTIPKSEASIRKTGGTTGKSLKLYATHDDVQERFAILDNFRSKCGYKLGEKTAWFSGKNLLTKSDLKKNRFWKTDYWYKVRYYSTFHIKHENLKFYINDLFKFQPKFLVGFPSTMYDIAKYGLEKKISFPSNTIKAIFPTAETVTKEIRSTIEKFFNAKIYDQYASSEGAPFIFECVNGNLHLELQSGVFEVLDEQGNETNKGRMIITSFTTYGTPLIRYDIGDEIELSNDTCNCGNNNPLVKQILGRINDYIYSPEIGKINLGNISNTLKGVNGIIKFQMIQNKLDELIILAIKDEVKFKDKDEKVFINNIQDRIGNRMIIDINYVNEIPVEKSGKFRIVKNNIKDQIERLNIV
ncbi:phenylacetate--CoA ligase family protein [Bacteroidota bacterium]